MKLASEFAEELLNKYCMPIKDGNGVMEAFVRRVQSDALESAAQECELAWKSAHTPGVTGSKEMIRQNQISHGCFVSAAAIRAMLEQRNRG